MVRRRTTTGLAVLSLLVPVALLAPGTAGADEDSTARFQPAPSGRGPIDAAVLPRALGDTSTVTVVVELSGDPVAVVQAEKGRKLTSAEKSSVKKSLKAAQSPAAAAVRAKGGTVDYAMQSAYNGLRVTISRDKVASLASVKGVVAVHALPKFEIDNEVSVPYLGVPQVWESTGYTGEGIKVAIIDTGIDYTHANFGGPGTVAAYEQAHAAETSAPNPALGWGVRVKGGYDFVGDDYDANIEGSVAKPDSNPLDCNGHGSHVAGSTGGSGVLPDGSTYPGPYDASTPSTDFEVGPGVAPEVDLYALRVFGCAGSSNYATEAIDWAVAHDMDVINMSLGSPYGTSGDSSAVAASNAVASGVVVVASAGNAGPNPYLSGSPGTGNGVVNVAANDSAKNFPGAALTFAGTTIQAININGEDLPAGPYEIVALRDLPGTAENEALGCSTAAYTGNGISSAAGAPLQIAVTVRGTCARVARAVFGQKAGADAVVMIDTSTGYPPYEGTITGNPDTGEEYLVTIPFLGVRGVLGAAPTDDGDKLIAADGQPLTMADSPLANPAFSNFASFSSGGPRTGDSAVSPSVTAPGVSIYSTAVGTGWQGSFKSGTSMAAPHVAGVAALGVQAHPSWSADEVAAALVNTADAGKIGNYRLTLGGAGLVDTAQTVATSVVAFGGSSTTESGDTVRVPSVSFGFAESATTFTGTKTVTVVNKGTSSKTYSTSAVATSQSQPATVTVSPSSVTVPAGGSATVQVTLTADASAIPPTTAGSGQHHFLEISGLVRLTSGSDALSVPYLMVPRPSSNGTVAPKQINSKAANGTPLNVSNDGGAVTATADFYTWGISDGNDVDESVTGGNGYDLRAAGVQSFAPAAGSTDRLLVFAVNTWDHYSNAAANVYQVDVDVDGDKVADWQIFSADSGLVRTGSADGLAEVFITDVSTDTTYVSGFLASAPTDNSTVLLPVYASDLGITDATGAFSYTVEAYAINEGGSDRSTAGARYDAWSKTLSSDAAYVEVAPDADSVQVRAKVDKAQWKAQGTLGQMVVFMDNRSGAPEAQLIPIK